MLFRFLCGVLESSCYIRSVSLIFVKIKAHRPCWAVVDLGKYRCFYGAIHAISLILQNAPCKVSDICNGSDRFITGLASLPLVGLYLNFSLCLACVGTCCVGTARSVELACYG